MHARGNLFLLSCWGLGSFALFLFFVAFHLLLDRCEHVWSILTFSLHGKYRGSLYDLIRFRCRRLLLVASCLDVFLWLLQGLDEGLQGGKSGLIGLNMLDRVPVRPPLLNILDVAPRRSDTFLFNSRQLFALRVLQKGRLDLWEQGGANVVRIPAIGREDRIPDVIAAGVDLRGEAWPLKRVIIWVFVDDIGRVNWDLGQRFSLPFFNHKLANLRLWSFPRIVAKVCCVGHRWGTGESFLIEWQWLCFLGRLTNTLLSILNLGSACLSRSLAQNRDLRLFYFGERIRILGILRHGIH